MVLQSMENAKFYACMRIDDETWYVMRFYFDLHQENNKIPLFKRFKLVKLVNGCYLACSCNLFIHIGVACVYIATIVNEINAHFWHEMHWK